MFLYELKLATKNKLILLCLIIGVALGIPGILSYRSDVTFITGSGAPEAVSCYQAWLYALSLGGASLYKIIAPLLIIPNLDSFFVERKNGYSNFVITRSNYKAYFFSKLFSGIIVSGAILIVSLLSWLAVCIVMFPHNMPIDTYTYISDEELRHFFVNGPIIYIAVVIALNFLFAAIFYSLGFGLSYFCKNRYIVMIIPFLIYLALTMLASILNWAMLSPVSMVAPHDIVEIFWDGIIIKYIIGISISAIVVLYSFVKSSREA